MSAGIDWYSSNQFESARSETMKKMLINSLIAPVAEPRAFLLGGQSGAGKSALHRICGQMLDGNAIVINGDEFRRSHPHFNEIQERYGVDAPAHTAKWSGAMTEALIDSFSLQHYNLIIEGTLRTSEVPLGTARLLRGRDYAVALAIMAVKPEISLVSCQIRYEMMRIAGTVPRATDPAHHDKIVHDIVDNLSTLEDSGLFEQVLIYNRAGAQLFPASGGTQSASETLRDAIFGSWSEEEQVHYENLQRQLQELREQ